jgi:predicted tellurium resistance membrane protein TerC
VIGFKDLDQNVTSCLNRTKSSNAVITCIVLMNLVFSFDSILAAIGLTSEIENATIALL